MEKKLTFKDYIKSLGPGAIMAAAIIGPGTVTTASTQGANYGYETAILMWNYTASFHQRSRKSFR